MNYDPFFIDVKHPVRLSHKSGHALVVSVTAIVLGGGTCEVGLSINGDVLPAESGYIPLRGQVGGRTAKAFVVYGDDIPGGDLIICPLIIGPMIVTDFQVTSSQIGADLKR